MLYAHNIPFFNIAGYKTHNNDISSSPNTNQSAQGKLRMALHCRLWCGRGAAWRCCWCCYCCCCNYFHSKRKWKRARRQVKVVEQRHTAFLCTYECLSVYVCATYFGSTMTSRAFKTQSAVSLHADAIEERIRQRRLVMNKVKEPYTRICLACMCMCVWVTGAGNCHNYNFSIGFIN